MPQFVNTHSTMSLELGGRSVPVLDTRTPSAAGSGITAVTTATTWMRVGRVGGLIETVIFVDLEGLNDGASDGDIIGKNATANCHFGQITTAVNGRIIAGSISCIEVPATGTLDIDVYSAVEATGTEDAAVSGLTETLLLAKAGNWAVNTKTELTTLPAADEYIYLVASGSPANAAYTTGQFVIRLLGLGA